MHAPTASPQNASRVLSRRDIDFLLHEWLDVERLTERTRHAEQSRETFDDVLELAERIACERFGPHNRAGDEHEPRLDDAGRVALVDGVQDAVEAFFASGMGAASADESVGGLQLPLSVTLAAYTWFHAANASTAAYPMLTVGAANLLLAEASDEQIARYAVPMLEGRFTGTMCLSEPQAGSSLTDITTRAHAEPDGTYRLRGTKTWISAGEHELAENIVHLVLAKIPGGPAGVKGISLFIVPRRLVDEGGAVGERNDVALAGLNHKMGLRGSVNTILSFGDGAHRPHGEAGAVGYLVGEPHRGLTYMFHMMNEARLAIGQVATALGYAGYLKSLAYAHEREQGRPVLSRDPSSPQIAIVEHPDVRRMLLAQKSYVEGALALVLYCGSLADDQTTDPDDARRAEAALLLDLLTPIAKSWPSQWCLEANSLAIQVHGGYGYARDYEVEQHYRDNRLNAIHEGTHAIQGLDLLARKVTMQGGRGLMVLKARIDESCERGRRAGGLAADLAAQLSAAGARLVDVTASAWSSGDIEAVLANATSYLEAAGHTVIAWMWLEQVLAAEGKNGAFYDGKRQAARYFFRYELPRASHQLGLVEELDRIALDTDPAWL